MWHKPEVTGIILDEIHSMKTKCECVSIRDLACLEKQEACPSINKRVVDQVRKEKPYTKYNDVNKDYQSKLANAIRIPVLIYSGKSIQKFPLGLGIDTKTAKSQRNLKIKEINMKQVYLKLKDIESVNNDLNI